MFRISVSSSHLDGFDEPDNIRCSIPQIYPIGIDVTLYLDGDAFYR